MDSNTDSIQQRAQKMEALVRKVEALSDASARAAAIELLQSLMDLHRDALDRALEIVFNEAGAGQAVIEKLGRDPLVSGLLLLYGLHPEDLETRVRRALDRVSPSLQKRGASAELLEIKEGTVRLRLSARGGGCGSTATALKDTVEEAMYSAAPDAARVEIEAIEEQQAPRLVQLETMNRVAPALKEK